MTDELMSLEEIERCEEDWGTTLGKQDVIFKTARAAHEWKAKYDARCAEVAAMVSETILLRREAAHWKANHDNKVKSLRLFTQRQDLPVDRIPAYEELVRLQKENEKLRAKLKQIESAEPVGYLDEQFGTYCNKDDVVSSDRANQLVDDGKITPLYTSPQSLNLPTEEELKDAIRQFGYTTKEQSWHLAEIILELLKAAQK